MHLLDSLQMPLSTTVVPAAPAVVETPDILDSLIYATIVLFILSVITEKLTQLTRAYPRPFRYIGILMCLLFYIPLARAFNDVYSHREDVLSFRSALLLFVSNSICLFLLIANSKFFKQWIAKVQIPWVRKFFAKLDVLCNIEKDSGASDHVVEREVTILSFILGFLVAYTFNANLFNLFRNPVVLGWDGVVPFKDNTFYVFNPAYFGFDFLPAVGFFLTAFFLAFGSKFFHDLLDTLLQAKNLKRKLISKETYDIETVSELEEYISFTQGQLVRKAIEENEKMLRTLKNFISVHEGIDPKGGNTIAYLNLSDNNVDGVPDKLGYSLSDKKKRFIPLRIVINVKTPSVSSGKVFHTSHPKYIGSLGVPILMDNEKFWLTCDHVLMEGQFDPQTQTGVLSSGDEVKFEFPNDTGVYQGTWKYGYQDQEFDIALVKPDSDKGIRPSGLLSAPCKVSLLTSFLDVSFKGAASKNTGVLIARDVQEEIAFRNKTVLMSGLLKISRRDSLESISKPGDSGAVLYSEDQQAVGIIIAVNEQYTYAMSLERIFAGWNAAIL
jgi:hypothetical protein